MSVRRLDPHQPASFAFTPDNAAWAQATIAKYPPGKQASAVIPLLWRGQGEHGGGVPGAAMRPGAGTLGMGSLRGCEIAPLFNTVQLSPPGEEAPDLVGGPTTLKDYAKAAK